MNENVHINEKDLHAFKNDMMSPEERIAFLEHIGSCIYCSEIFADFMSTDLVEAPKDMKANILNEVSHEKLIKYKIKETSRRMQLFIYSLKVGTAACLALLMLFLTMSWLNAGINPDKYFDRANKKIQQKTSIAATIKNSMDAICDDMLKFSNKIIE